MQLFYIEVTGVLKPVKLVRLCGHLHTVYKVFGQLGICMVLKM